MNKQDAQTGVKILGIIAIIFGSLQLLGALALLALAGVTVAFDDAAVVLGSFILIAAALLLISGSLLLAGGIGALKQRAWCRIPMLIRGGVVLLNFPLGTIFGVFTIWLFGFEENVKKLLK